MEIVFWNLRRRLGRSYVQRNESRHQISNIWRSRGQQKSIMGVPRRPRRGCKKLRRGSMEVVWELWEVHKTSQATTLDTFNVFRASKQPPGDPQVTVYRLRRRFRASTTGTGALDFRLGRARSDPRTRSRTRFLHLYYWKPRSKRRCSLLTGGSADDGKRFWCWTLWIRAPAGTE